jgi:hypothetical protein
MTLQEYCFSQMLAVRFWTVFLGCLKTAQTSRLQTGIFLTIPVSCLRHCLNLPSFKMPQALAGCQGLSGRRGCGRGLWAVWQA